MISVSYDRTLARRVATFALSLMLCSMFVSTGYAQRPAGMLRIATYNVSLFRSASGQLARELRRGDSQQARKLAQVIQIVRPDVLLLNEIDYDSDHSVLRIFLDQYLARGQQGESGIEFQHHFAAPSNTGIDSGLDLDADGVKGEPDDAWGFGRYPGQYAMAVVSRYPIDRQGVRTFQKLRWSTMPNARRPIDPTTGESYYADAVWQQLRLSSKSHWDVPIAVPQIGVLHLLVSHPTPPVFDGPEDRNGCRNFDEIRFWADYISPSPPDYLIDDQGRLGGLGENKLFVIAGDLNCDPADGDTKPAGIDQLLKHPRVNGSLVPRSAGGVAAAKRAANLNANRRGDPAMHTADFGGDGVGNLRVDYVLPARDLPAKAAGVFWPAPGERGSNAVTATDHRLVWIDIELPAADDGHQPRKGHSSQH
jgi:hypothetical protein